SGRRDSGRPGIRRRAARGRQRRRCEIAHPHTPAAPLAERGRRGDDRDDGGAAPARTAAGAQQPVNELGPVLPDEDVTMRLHWAIVARPAGGAAEETMTGEIVRVLIADDHPLVVGGLREAVLAAAPGADIAVAHDFDSMAAALEASPETDLVLLDLTMPGVRGFSGLLFLRSERPSTPVIVVSGDEDRAVIRHCLEFGAAGFIPKSNSPETMRDAIAQVLAGGRWTPADFDPGAQPNRESSALARRLASLTPQQIRVLMMLSQGLLNKQIAYELSVSEATVKAHVSAI